MLATSGYRFTIDTASATSSAATTSTAATTTPYRFCGVLLCACYCREVLHFTKA